MTTATSNPIGNETRDAAGSACTSGGTGHSHRPEAQPAAPISIGGADAGGDDRCVCLDGEVPHGAGDRESARRKLARASGVPEEPGELPARARHLEPASEQASLPCMQNLYIISWKPSWSAKFSDFHRQRVRPLHTALRWRWEGEKVGRIATAAARGRRSLSTGEECVGPLINWELAKAEGWTNRGGLEMAGRCRRRCSCTGPPRGGRTSTRPSSRSAFARNKRTKSSTGRPRPRRQVLPRTRSLSKSACARASRTQRRRPMCLPRSLLKSRTRPPLPRRPSRKGGARQGGEGR